MQLFFSEVASTILVDLRTCEHHSHSKTIKILSFVSTLKRACVHIPFFPGAERSPILVRHRVKGRMRVPTYVRTSSYVYYYGSLCVIYIYGPFNAGVNKYKTKQNKTKHQTDTKKSIRVRTYARKSTRSYSTHCILYFL